MIFTASGMRGTLAAVMMLTLLCGCGGTKVLKEPQPLA